MGNLTVSTQLNTIAKKKGNEKPSDYSEYACTNQQMRVTDFVGKWNKLYLYLEKLE
jgi:hypothetical protein